MARAAAGSLSPAAAVTVRERTGRELNQTATAIY